MLVDVITPIMYFVVQPYIKDGVWDGKNWILLGYIDFEVNGRRHRIPAGFVTDFASIPKLARVTINRIGLAIVGFVIHDWLRKDEQQEYTTQQCDEILYLLMRLFGEGWYTSNKVYYALRSLGWTCSVGDNVTAQVKPGVIEHINKSNFYVKKEEVSTD